MNETLNKKLPGGLSMGSVATFFLGVLVFAALSWIYFYPNDVNGDVMQQGDVMQGLANGHEAQEYAAAHDGEVTRWTGSLFSGMPTFQISPSYESNSLLYWVQNVFSLGFPKPVNWIFMLMLGFFILMLAFKVKWYVAILGAIGYAFSSYFFIIIDAGHIWKVLTLAYIPPTLAGIVLAYRGRYLLGSALAALFAAMQLLSNHVQMTYYSLFIIVALVIAFLVQAIARKQLKRWCIASVALACAAALAVVANSPNLWLTAKYSQETMRGGHSELTPLPKQADAQAPQQKETPTSSGLSKEYITQWSYGIDETWTLLVPNVKGGSSMHALSETPKFETLEAQGDIDPAAGQVMGVFSQYFGDQPFTSGPVYVGAFIFVLFILGCAVVKGPVKWALLAVTLLSVALSWGHNMMWLTDLFIDHMPMYNKFRTVSSILVIAELTMPLLAVMALNQALTEEDFWPRHRRAVLIALGAGVVLCVVMAVMPGLFDTGVNEADRNRVLMATGGQMTYDDLQGQVPGLSALVATLRDALVSSDAWRSLLVIVIAGGALVAHLQWGRGPKTAAIAGCFIALVVLVDMYNVNKRYLNEDSFVSADEVAPTTFTPRPADSQILQDKDMNYRVYDVTSFEQPMPSYFHKHVGGYHAAKLSRYNDLIERQLAPRDKEPNMAVLNMLNTRYFIMSPNEAQRNPAALGNAWFVDTLAYVKSADDEMRFLDTFNPATTAVAGADFKKVLGEAVATTPGDTIVETSYAPNRLTYKSHSARGGVAVLSEVYFPWGWKATIDGKETPIGRVNYVLRALRVPAGDHDIVLTFDPQEVHTATTAARWAIIAIFVLLLAAVAVPVFTRRKQQE